MSAWQHLQKKYLLGRSGDFIFSHAVFPTQDFISDGIISPYYSFKTSHTVFENHHMYTFLDDFKHLFRTWKFGKHLEKDQQKWHFYWNFSDKIKFSSLVWLWFGLIIASICMIGTSVLSVINSPQISPFFDHFFSKLLRISGILSFWAITRISSLLKINK